jgi:enamine deaminase RidA (YjgF/YER057c/UK114 family)
VPAVEAAGLVFVSGHDPEAQGRLVYRGRVGRELTPAVGRAAARLATLNAFASARAALGSLDCVRRCITLTAFVDGTGASLSPAILDRALALVRALLGQDARPVVWLRPATGLAGGMPVEVELLLEVTPRTVTRETHR